MDIMESVDMQAAIAEASREYTDELELATAIATIRRFFSGQFDIEKTAERYRKSVIEAKMADIESHTLASLLIAEGGYSERHASIAVGWAPTQYTQRRIRNKKPYRGNSNTGGWNHGIARDQGSTS